MMPIEQLEELQARFEPVRLERQARYDNLEKLLRQFAKRFPRSQIRQLSLEDYVQGKGSKKSFCYWVERETEELGRIQGSPSTKFGIYYGKEQGAFQFTKKYKSETDARDRILAEIDELLTAAERDDVEAIRGSGLSPMFRGKILFLYFPKKFLNIFSERHVDHYLRELRANDPGGNLDLISKRERLVQIKNADDVMKHWTMFEFSDFLIEEIKPPLPRGAKVPPKLEDYFPNFPDPEETAPEFIDLQVGETPDSRAASSSRSGGITDFEKKNRRNKRTGDQGEQVVFLAEQRHLERSGRPDLAKRVKLVCRDNDRAGYDILSFDLDESEKLIEVKSTTAKVPELNDSFQFHLSAKELEHARAHTNFHLYLVFDLKSKNPKIWPISNPASLEPKRLLLTPSAYYATLTIA
jgi:hypothetical protein